MFFGQHCYVPEIKMLKIMFIQRFVKFLNSPRNALGFIPDIYRIFGKYKFTKYLFNFAESATFPKLPFWEKIINRAITDHTNEEYRNRLMGDENLTKYLVFHSEYISQVMHGNLHSYIEIININFTYWTIIFSQIFDFMPKIPNI